MKRLTRNTSVLGAALVFALFCTGAALAAAGYTLFGDAELVSPGNASPTAAQIRSDASPGYGGVDFDIPSGLTVADLDNLATDYKLTEGTCGGGSPRFQLNVTNGTDSGNIFVYLGTPPNYTCVPGVWLSSGNLASPANLVDTSQLDGGTFYDPYAAAQVKYGAYEITGIQLVVDAGWAMTGGVQTAHVDNVQINTSTTTFESADSCKKGGWQNFTSAPGPFKNQGQCVSYFAKGGQ